MKKRLNEIKERKKALAEELKGEVTEERVKEIEDEVEGLETGRSYSEAGTGSGK